MDPEGESPPAASGDEFEHEDGTVEVVFELAGHRVLTVREYPTRDTFRRSVAGATYRGENEAVSELPDIDAFEDG